MGQRLVIQIEENSKPLANAYYHWSAYTESAIDLINEIIEHLNDAPDNHNTFIAFNEGNKFRATWALYMTGARFNDDEIHEIEAASINKDDFKFVFDGAEVNRSKGLLTITENGMKDNLNYAEETAFLDLSTGSIDFGVMFEEDTEAYIERNTENGQAPDLNHFPILDLPECPNYFDTSWNEYQNNIKSAMRSSYTAISPDRSTIYKFIG